MCSSDLPKPHQHDGAEFLHVLKGELALVVGEEELSLEAGDSIYFDSSQPHHYAPVGASSCEALVVTAP